ncbi:hypothetical protein [Nocardia brasiliensis]|uniref:hypothetical protein n=1 Tax=Nocardia brasiliensis TaxID=37326 RepID=UPI003D8B584B
MRSPTTPGAELQARIAAGLRVLDRIDTIPRPPHTRDATDPLHTAHPAEITSLRRLG